MKSWFIIFGILFPTLCFGQLLKALSIIDEVEIFGGVSSLSIRGSDEVGEGRQSMFRLNGGINFKYNFNDQIGLLSGLDYSLKGGRQIIDVIYYDEMSNTEKTGQNEYINEYRYLILPLFIRYKFLKKRLLFVEVGGYYGFLRRANTTLTLLYSGYTHTSNDTESYERSDFGILGGLGLNLPIRNKLSVLLKITTNMGLADISNLDPQMFTHDVIKTNSSSFLAGINLKL
jgi:hypothetical protein